jgi:hypothetical protein
MGGVQTTYVPTARTGDAAKAAETNPEGIAEPLPDEAVAPMDTLPAPLPQREMPTPVQPKAKPTP